jgi:glycosyltransferase involved in cell wall biosynthesis
MDVKKDYSKYISKGLFGNVMSYFCCSSTYSGYQIFQVYKLYRDYIAIKPDVVVGWGHEICIYSYLAAILAKVPHVVFCIRTVNPSLYQNKDNSIFKKLHKIMSLNLTTTIVNSSFIKSDHAKWIDINENKITVCNNGIDKQNDMHVADLNIRSMLNIAPNNIVVLNIGRFSPEKGQQILVQAAELLQKYHKGFEDVHWILCGDGSTRIQIEEYIKDRKINNIHMPGAVNNIADYLLSADIFVMPSDFEGQPNAMMEAMTFGLPCISTNMSGALDLAEDGKEAIFVPPRNSEILADKIEYLIKHPEKRKHIGENARKKIADFSVDKMVINFNEIIRNAVSAR